MRHFLFLGATGLFIFAGGLFANAAFGAASTSTGEAGLSREALLAELTGKDDSKLNDVDLYAEIIAAYQMQDDTAVRDRVRKFVSRYPQSPFADNALYLAGRMALEKKRYGEALKYFQRVITEYPHSNRVVSAEFAKALAYKKMNLAPESRKVFQQVMQRFPGSPESYRAENEMRLLR